MDLISGLVGSRLESPSGRVGQPNGGLQPDQLGLGHWVGSGGFLAGFGAKTPGWGFMPSPLPSLIFIGLYMIIALIITLNIAIFSNVFNIRTSWVKIGWAGLGRRIFDLPNVGL